MKPTDKDLAKQALEVLSLQREFFNARPGSAERSTVLSFAKAAEAKLRKMAEATLAPPTLFSDQD